MKISALAYLYFLSPRQGTRSVKRARPNLRVQRARGLRSERTYKYLLGCACMQTHSRAYLLDVVPFLRACSCLYLVTDKHQQHDDTLLRPRLLPGISLQIMLRRRVVSAPKRQTELVHQLCACIYICIWVQLERIEYLFLAYTKISGSNIGYK